MSAERLRDAARVLRERVSGADEYHIGPWITDSGKGGTTEVFCENRDDETTFVVDCDRDGTAAYIATVSPPFALAVADWLEHYATRCAMMRVEPGPHETAVADAVLGADR